MTYPPELKPFPRGSAPASKEKKPKIGEALLVGLIPTIFLMIATAVVVVALGLEQGSERREMVIDGASRLILIVFGLATWSSWSAQAGKRKTAWGAALVIIIGIVTIIVMTIAATMRTPPELTPAERAAPAMVEVDGKAWLEHGHLGFSMRTPGSGYAPLSGPDADAIRRQLTQTPTELEAWVYQDSTSGSVLIVAIGKVGTVEVSFLEGIRDGLSEAVSSQQGRVVTDTISDGELNFVGVMQGVQMFVRARGELMGPEREEFIVLLVGLGLHAAALQSAITSFQPVRVNARSE